MTHRERSQLKIPNDQVASVLQLLHVKDRFGRARAGHGGVKPLAPSGRPEYQQRLAVPSTTIGRQVAYRAEVAAVVGMEMADPEGVHLAQ